MAARVSRLVHNFTSSRVSDTIVMDKLHELRKLSPALFNLLRGYAALSPTRFLVFPFDLAFDIVHDFLLTDLLLNPLFMTYPPSQQYQATFWKWALNSLENYIGDSEVCILIRIRPYDIH